MDKPRDDLERLLRLLSLQTDGLLDDEQWEELVALVSASEEARKVYIEHMFLHSMMHRATRLTEPSPLLPQELKQSAGMLTEDRGAHVGAVLVDLLGDALRAGTSFFSRTLVLTLLLAVGLPGILFLLLVLNISRQTLPAGPVAAVTRIHECAWSKNAAPVWSGKSLFAGEQIRLARGFAEVTFFRGGKVLLQGPATFSVTSDFQGFLADGSLVARAGREARGFTIATPAVTVVDLGTEFGVRVEDNKGSGQIEVFQGKVELRATAKDNPDQTLREHLVGGQAARIELSAAQGALPIVRQVTPVATAFVRRMPAAPVKTPEPEKPPAVVVAEFSGGPGNSQADQFPGVAGAGWSGPWSVGDAKEVNCVASIEEANPLLGGGKYLHALVERTAGGGDAVGWTGVDRCLALAGPVDLTKPYVVSFDLRVDNLGRFAEGGDRLSICSRNQSQVDYARTVDISSGWHICTVGRRSRLGRSGNWVFLGRNERGKASNVDSGIPVREGDVYSIRILVDPAAKKWTPSIAVNAGLQTAFAPMGMRSRGEAKDNGYWPFLHLYGRLEGGSQGNDVEKIGFSVDSIRITPASAPEGGPQAATRDGRAEAEVAYD